MVPNYLFLYMETVLSGMRPTGKLHLGHWVGALSKWVRLQQEYKCFFMVADWHALMSEYIGCMYLFGQKSAFTIMGHKEEGKIVGVDEFGRFPNFRGVARALG